MYESDEDDYYKPIRIGNAFSSNYIEHESNGENDYLLIIIMVRSDHIEAIQ